MALRALLCVAALLRGRQPLPVNATGAALLGHEAAAASGSTGAKPAWTPDLHAPVVRAEIEVFGSPDFVEMQKYRNVLLPLRADGAVAAIHFELSSPKLSIFVVPELVYHDPIESDNVASQVRAFVQSGRVLILGLSSPSGMNYPLGVLNRAFGMQVAGVDLPCQEPIRKDSNDGIAQAFNAGPPVLPCGRDATGAIGAVHGLHIKSLPKGARCVYRESEGCAVVAMPYGEGVVVAFGYDFLEPDAGWNEILLLAVGLGANLKEMMRGNATISGTSTDWKATGQLDVFGGEVPKVECKGWRRTLNCHPAGPRLPKGDRGCTELVPGDESGFCDCGAEFTNAATCAHRAFTCQQACDFLGRQYRDVFGNSYKTPTEAQMVAQLAGADKKYAEARGLADHAVQALDRAVRASTDYVDGVHAMLRPKTDTDPWIDVAAAGRRAEEAGQNVQDMVGVARWGRSRGANIADPVP